MIDKGPVLLDIADGIARLRLNRPDAANGMSAELLSALCDAIMVCHGQPDLRVLFTSGRAAGADTGSTPDDFLAKPYRRDALAERVRAVLDAQSRRVGD